MAIKNGLPIQHVLSRVTARQSCSKIFFCKTKFPTVLLVSCMALIEFTTGAPSTNPTRMSTTQFKASISSSETATSIPKTTTIPTTVFTKISSTSTKTSSASSKAITYDIDVSYMSHSSDFLECSLQYSAQFDDRIIKPALTLLNPLGIEVNIFLNPWAVDNQPPTVGVPAHSQLNPIVTAFEQQATNGTPSLTILYPDSNLKSFDLHSFYFGYLANTSATAVDVALQCTIAVAGFREGQEVTVAGYTFTLPTVAVDVPMIQRCCRGVFWNRRM